MSRSEPDLFTFDASGLELPGYDPRPECRVPAFLPHGLAFVDIETTGGPAQRESITEIGIIEVDADGVRAWSSLVRPAARIPDHIVRLTGITNEMVADAPPFAVIADEVYDRLDGRLFVAHNARFDHGYLRAAFRRLGMDIRPQVLCTVRLSRRLFPEHRHHGLDHLVERFGLQVEARHRALGDADLVWQFWRKLQERCTPGRIDEAVRAIIGQPTMPPGLDPSDLEGLPDAPGVYLFYGDNDLPLYIGKSARLRRRVLAHFCADHASDRELELSQAVRRIEWQETSGNLGAMLREATLVKALQPLHNRRLRHCKALWTWRLERDLFGDGRLALVSADSADFGPRHTLYGLFRSRRDAMQRLRMMARQHALCPPLLGLERPPAKHRCFTFQVKQCRGACSGEEPFHAHAERSAEALEALRLAHWPHAGPIGLVEGGTTHVVDRWRYLGSADDPQSVAALLTSCLPAFDADIYRILTKAMAEHEAVPLGHRAGRH